MATKGKRPYEKPVLQSSSVFGADTTTCCRTGSCTTSQRTSMGKNTASNTTS
jgi:hypothetical protein